MVSQSALITMRVLFFTYLAIVVFIVSSCQKSSDSSNAGVVTTDCVNNPALCQNGIYSQNPGFRPYNYNNGYNYGYNNGYATGSPFYYMNNAAYLCNCPTGTMPTYNNYGGLGCVQNSYVYGAGGLYAYAYFGYSNNQWMNIPQVSNLSAYSNNGCYNGIVQSCVVNNPNSCSAGYTCRPTTAASALGMCVSNNANAQPYYNGYR